MKQSSKLFFLLITCCLFFISNSKAQAPNAIPYQAVARDISNNILSNQIISLRFSIHDATSGGTVVYKETQSATTNSLGLFTVNIGQGTVVTGTFAAINWSTNSKFLQVEMDATGGTTYVNMGTQQLMSVPYSLNSATSADNKWNSSGSNINSNNSGNVGIGVSSPTAKLHTTGTTRHEGLSGTGTRPVFADGSGNLVIAHDSIYTGTNSTAGAIPDGSCTGVSNSITLSGLPVSISSSTIFVTVNITHPLDGDVRIYLTAPNGSILNLAFANGGVGANFTNTVFSDNAAGFLSSGTAPFAGSFKPTGNMTTVCSTTATVGTFAAIGGGTINPNGTWSIKIFDQGSNGVTGTLNNWSVSCVGAAVNIAGTNNYLPKWSNANLTSTSNVYDDGTNVGIGTTSPAQKLDVNGKTKTSTFQMATGAANGYVMKSDASGNASWSDATVVVPSIANSSTNNTPGTIPDQNCTGLTSNITISGLPSSIPSDIILVTVNITMNDVSDLSLMLIAPNGSILSLNTLHGCFYGSNFTNTIFTDHAADCNLTGAPNPPNSGSFKPSSYGGYCAGITPNVSSFGQIGGGTINPNGTWQLKLLDEDIYSSNPGILNNWSISFPTTSSGMWSTTGNTGASATNNFIGNIDNLPLRFKVNNQQAGIIDPFNYNTSYGQLALASNLGNFNTALGESALFANTVGSNNTSVGSHSLPANINGNYNVAVGNWSLYTNIDGDLNTAIGEGALINNNTGNYNTAVGADALPNNQSGNNNTAIGYDADAGANLTNATAIGYQAHVTQSNCLVLGSGANVGIGTSAPSSKLHTIASGAKTANYSGNLFTATATSSTSSVTKAGVEIQSTGTWNGFSSKNIGLYVSSVTGGANNYDAIFNGGGNVGIGVGTPASKLQIQGTGNTSSSKSLGILNSSNSEIFSVHDDGKVGIGNNNFQTPQYTLEIFGEGSTSATGSLRIQNTNGDTLFFVRNDGNIGIGNSVPLQNLHVKQSASNGRGIRIQDGTSTDAWVTYLKNEDADKFIFYYNGADKASISTAGVYATISDKRFKTDITPVYEVLDKVRQLKPSMYFMKDDAVRKQKNIGFIAQEAESLFPEAVFTNDEYKSIAYDYFAVIAIKAIQEMDSTNTVKDRKIADLDQQNAELRNEVNQLKSETVSFREDIGKIKAQLGIATRQGN